MHKWITGIAAIAAVGVTLAGLAPDSVSAASPVNEQIAQLTARLDAVEQRLAQTEARLTEAESHLPLTAVIDRDGTLAYGNGAISARYTGTDGVYFVGFDRDVSGCTRVAAGGDFPGDGYAGPDDSIVVGSAPLDSDPTSVFLLQWDGELGFDWPSSPLHLIVAC